MWAIVIKILHHPMPTSHTMWQLHLREMQWWTILWTTQSEYSGWYCWKVLDQVLAAATIKPGQYNSPETAGPRTMEWLQQCLEQWRDYNNAMNCSICTKPIKSADKKVHGCDHLAGENKGPAHKVWDLNYCINPKKVKIPCSIHKLKGILFLCYSYFHIC